MPSWTTHPIWWRLVALDAITSSYGAAASDNRVIVQGGNHDHAFELFLVVAAATDAFELMRPSRISRFPGAPVDKPGDGPVDGPGEVPANGASSERLRGPDRREVPSREQIETLEPFPGIHPTRIVVVDSPDRVDAAYAVLAAQSHVGFDTESKPTFTRGEISEGPHVLQFATLDHAYIFQLHVPGSSEAVAALLGSRSLTKVGFGLDGDKTQIRARLAVEPREVLDLDSVFQERGYRKSVGLKVAVAIVFQRRFSKSKSTGTSNWSNRQLTDRQLLYAANDAYAAMRVFVALDDGWT